MTVLYALAIFGMVAAGYKTTITDSARKSREVSLPTRWFSLVIMLGPFPEDGIRADYV